MKQAFDMKNNERLGPLLKKVSDTVEETAKEQGLVLVLDQENVMYGGVNLTDAVTKKLLLKKK
jgi:Skp family chaperone for outer membrane proteins